VSAGADDRQVHRGRWRYAAGAVGLALAAAACTSAPANPPLTTSAPMAGTGVIAGSPTLLPTPSPSAAAVSAERGPSASSSVAAVGTLAANIALVSPRDVTAAFGSIWVSNGPAATVTRLDPQSAAVEAVVYTPDPASVITSGSGALFITSYPTNSLTRIDPVTNQATTTISLASAGDGPVGVAVADGYVWVADHDGTPTTSIAKVDPRSMTIVDVIPVGKDSQAGPQWVVSAAGSIWTDVANMSAIVRIDARTDAVQATIPIAGGCGAEMVGTDDAVWVANGGGDGCANVVYRIDPRTNAVAQTIPMDSETGMLALGLDGLWFGSSQGTVGRIDPMSGTVTGRMKIPGAAFGAAVAGGSLWISDRDDERVFEIVPS
jgi:streptogramin lyase